jgi:N-hydroxyarylamine O-acetyltransferase
MSEDFDLDAYFVRIGYDGPREPTLETLRALHLAHPQAIPFENLDPLLRREVKLDMPSLTDKLVRGGRGGYCFEHNAIFLAALKALGFQANGLSARVELRGPEITARTHMLIRVVLPEGEFVADVGFGGLIQTAPLRLQADIEQATPHGRYRLTAVGDSFRLEARLSDRWAPMYRFELSESFAPDYEAANWYVSTHPASPFLSMLMCARAGADFTLALGNGGLSIYRNGEVERRTVETPEALAAVLRDEFGITLPEGTEAALARVLQPPS